MKKYIKSKIAHNKITSRASEPSPSDPYISNYVKNIGVEPEVQFPLPLDPPLPDEPPNMNIELKEEIVDIDYQSSIEESPDTSSQGSADFKSTDRIKSEKPRPMCRDYIRGKCVRPETCKFRDKCHESQLVGVYTFCRNYQNSVCTLPNCKYVHASVFEEQHFYRTADLPAHALAHHKKPIVPEDSPPNIPTVFKVPPPPLPLRLNGPRHSISYTHASKSEAQTFPDVTGNISPQTSILKSDWPCSNNCSSHDIGPESEGVQNRCVNCKFLELRVEVLKEKKDKEEKSILERRAQLDLLSNKKEKCKMVLWLLLTSQPFKQRPRHTTLSSRSRRSPASWGWDSSRS